MRDSCTVSALPRVLGTDDLPLSELCAARLDGELFPFARGWIPSDVPGTPAERARAAVVGIPRRWVAELDTAAWVWGARDLAPEPARFAAPRDVRGAKTRAGVAVREAVLRRADWIETGGVRVTTPARTLLDLLRSHDFADATEVTALRLLDLVGDADLVAVRTRLAHLPWGRIGAARLAWLSPR